MKQEILTFLLASAPIFELRGSIPLAIGVFGFSIPKAFLISIAGNIFFIAPFLMFLEKFSDYLMHKWFFYNRLMSWVFERTRRKHLDHTHEKKWTHWALFFFVAIPLPMTGAWSGAVVAYILGMPFKRSILTIFLGILMSGVVVTTLTSFGLLAAKSFF